MKIAIITYPGSNCEKDCFHATHSLDGMEGILVSSEEKNFPAGTEGIILPGGFSYGDYIRPGVLAKTAPLAKALYEEAEKGTPILGICNGFQILCELRLLPGILLKNTGGKFICQDIYLKTNSTKSPFLKKCPSLFSLPIAHKYGQYYASPEAYSSLVEKEQIAFFYSTEKGEVNPQANLNGSLQNIAGITNERGNILGLMPHPERRIFPWCGGESGKELLKGFWEFLN